MRRVGLQWVPFSLLYGTFVVVITDGTMFLERGQRGIVPCPLPQPEDVDAMYWYFGSTSDTSILISYFLGRVAPQNGIPEGVYDIDNEFNLVIENVTASKEGTYYFKLKPHLLSMKEGQIEVCDKVSPRHPYPTVIGCNQDHDADTCEVRVRHDSTVRTLTCVMEQVKPAVELRWIHVFRDRFLELKASTAVRPVVLPAYTGSSMRNNTYSTSASIQVPSVHGDAECVCEAIGVAVGNGTRTRVYITGAFGHANTNGKVLLERGQRGIVPCPPIKSSKFSPEIVVAMYWYYGSISRTSLLISHFLGRVAPQNGIPEGVYDIDNEFNLVVKNVTASNEGTYYFQLKPYLKMVEAGQVEVCDKVSPNQPYPTIIGCDPDIHDAETCQVRVWNDSTVQNLTCVMEQVKPAVDLRWILVFWGGWRDLNAYPTIERSLRKKNTYSTSVTVQVTVADDEEVYVCEAMGVVVGKGTRMKVRFTKSHLTTATYEEVQSSINPGTMLVLANEVPPTASKPDELCVPLIALWVGFSISVILNVIVFVCSGHMYRKRKLNGDNSASNMQPYNKVPTTSSSDHNTESNV
ncbi:uncharacterized protein LOC119733174 [Patiria miniata]|uniref:Ig-like domain-containing protein n=1 Tax=Patiria miniata TaxID=46514 RepID=A0A914AFD3_PATMI|nr:uncharacterized protein LOC119733174 [Patiria miniata]